MKCGRVSKAGELGSQPSGLSALPGRRSTTSRCIIFPNLCDCGRTALSANRFITTPELERYIQAGVCHSDPFSALAPKG
jgi:hypothetical protein